MDWIFINGVAKENWPMRTFVKHYFVLTMPIGQTRGTLVCL